MVCVTKCETVCACLKFMILVRDTDLISNIRHRVMVEICQLQSANSVTCRWMSYVSSSHDHEWMVRISAHSVSFTRRKVSRNNCVSLECHYRSVNKTNAPAILGKTSEFLSTHFQLSRTSLRSSFDQLLQSACPLCCRGQGTGRENAKSSSRMPLEFR